MPRVWGYSIVLTLYTCSSPSKTNSTLEASLCLAHISLDALLSSSNPPPSVASGNSLSDETKSSALLLPLVEETLKKFVNFLQSQKKSPSCSLPGTLSSTRLCSWNSPESLGGRSAGNGNSQESEVAYVLFVLYLLVSRSGHARASLIGGSSEKRDDGIHVCFILQLMYYTYNVMFILCDFTVNVLCISY